MNAKGEKEGMEASKSLISYEIEQTLKSEKFVVKSSRKVFMQRYKRLNRSVMYCRNVKTQ